jgi:hypothetical protein
MLQKTDTPPQAVREFMAEGKAARLTTCLIISNDLVPSNDD